MSVTSGIAKDLKDAFPKLKLKLEDKPSHVEVFIKSGEFDMIYPDAVSEKYGFFPVTMGTLSNPEWMTEPSWKEIVKLRAALDSIAVLMPNYKMYVGLRPQSGYNR